MRAYNRWIYEHQVIWPTWGARNYDASSVATAEVAENSQPKCSFYDTCTDNCCFTTRLPCELTCCLTPDAWAKSPMLCITKDRSKDGGHWSSPEVTFTLGKRMMMVRYGLMPWKTLLSSESGSGWENNGCTLPQPMRRVHLLDHIWNRQIPTFPTCFGLKCLNTATGKCWKLTISRTPSIETSAKRDGNSSSYCFNSGWTTMWLFASREVLSDPCWD